MVFRNFSDFSVLRHKATPSSAFLVQGGAESGKNHAPIIQSPAQKHKIISTLFTKLSQIFTQEKTVPRRFSPAEEIFSRSRRYAVAELRGLSQKNVIRNAVTGVLFRPRFEGSARAIFVGSAFAWKYRERRQACWGNIDEQRCNGLFHGRDREMKPRSGKRVHAPPPPSSACGAVNSSDLLGKQKTPTSGVSFFWRRRGDVEPPRFARNKPRLPFLPFSPACGLQRLQAAPPSAPIKRTPTSGVFFIGGDGGMPFMYTTASSP